MTLPYPKAGYLVCCGLTSLLLSGTAVAANVEIAKFVEIGVTTTDNLTLEDVDSAKQSDVVLNIKPSVELKFSGNRFGIVALGELEYFQFDKAEESVVDPRLFVRASGTLVDGLLYVDSKLALSRLLSDSLFLRPSDDGDTAAKSDTTIYIERSFGRVAELYTGYTFSTLAERAGGDFENSKHALDFSLGRNPKYGRYIWGFGGSFSRDESDTNEFENAYVYGRVGASLNQTVLAEFTYGLESRELINSVDTANPIATEYDNTSLWEAQLNWAPSELTRLTVGYGERFFGAGPSMQLRHRVRNSSIRARYTREITRQAASLNGIAILGANVNPSIADTDSLTIDNANNLAPLDEPFVDNRFQLSYKLKGRRSDVIVDGVYSEKEPLTGSDTIRSLLGRVVFDRRLSGFLSLRLQYDYQKSEARNRAPLNYIENRFAIKFIYSFDGNELYDENDLEIN